MKQSSPDYWRMVIAFSWNGQRYKADLSAPMDIAIPLRNGAEHQPNAYGAPLFEMEPVHMEGFIGSLEAGAPVNFFNVRINPHGNGTHTECVGHILAGPYTLRECMQRSHFIAELITVTPEVTDQGSLITKAQLENASHGSAEALVVRTLPNTAEKLHRSYTGSNPPFFAPDGMDWVRSQGYLHLLTDLPSVDPEVDGGTLAAHKSFWDVPGNIRAEATITELVYVPGNIPDGLYLLDIHNLAIDLDVSPSRPMLYEMEKLA